MIEQQGNALTFYAYFVASKQGKTGLTVTADTYRNGTLIGAGGNSATEVAGGLYKYTLSSASNNAEGEYITIFKTSDTSVDQQHIPSLWTVGKAGVENLDAAVSSRLDADDYQAPATGGSGTDQFEYISTKDGVPEAGVNVWVTSTNDPTFDVVGGTLISNAQGKTVFMLNPGSTYYVWEMKDGVNFNSPEEVEL